VLNDVGQRQSAFGQRTLRTQPSEHHCGNVEGSRESRLDEAGVRCVDTVCWFPMLKRHADQAHREWQLDVAKAAFVTIDEVLQEERNVAPLQIAAPTQLLCDIRETSDDQCSAVLKYTTRMGLLYWPASRSRMTASSSVALSSASRQDPAESAKIVHHQVDVVIVTVGSGSEGSTPDLVGADGTRSQTIH
jgi:hypothetical protein